MDRDELIIPKRARFTALSESKGNWGHAGRPGMRGGSSSGGTAQKAVQSIKANGGVTINVHGDMPKTGYAVAGTKDRNGNTLEKQFARDITTQDVANYMKTNAEPLAQPNHFLGGWVEDGVTFLDVPQILPTRAAALASAHQRDEIAIYDLSKVGTDEDGTIHTMSDKKRPSESKGERIKESKSSSKKFLLMFGADQSPQQIAEKLNAARADSIKAS